MEIVHRRSRLSIWREITVKIGSKPTKPVRFDLVQLREKHDQLIITEHCKAHKTIVSVISIIEPSGRKATVLKLG